MTRNELQITRDKMTKEKTNIKLTFIVYGEMFDIEQLTRIIGVTPTDQAYKGDQLKYRISEETFWEYKFAPIETLLTCFKRTFSFYQSSSTYHSITVLCKSL